MSKAMSNLQKACFIHREVVSPHFMPQVKHSSHFTTRVTQVEPTRASRVQSTRTASASRVELTRASPVQFTRATRVVGRVTWYWIPNSFITNPSTEASTSSVFL